MQVRVAAARTRNTRFGAAADAPREIATDLKQTHERIRARPTRRRSRPCGRLTVRAACEPLITHALEAVPPLRATLIGTARIAATATSVATTTGQAGLATVGERRLAGGLCGHEVVATRGEAPREATTRRATVTGIGAVLTASDLRLLDRGHAH